MNYGDLVRINPNRFDTAIDTLRAKGINEGFVVDLISGDEEDDTIVYVSFLTGERFIEVPMVQSNLLLIEDSDL